MRKRYLLGRKGLVGGLTPFAREVINLAGLGLGRVTGGVLATKERVDVSASRGAVAISRKRVVVNVVD